MAAPGLKIEEAAVALAVQALLVVAMRIGGEQNSARSQGGAEFAQDPRQLPARHVKQGRVREDAVEAARGQGEREKILVQDLAAGKIARHGDELLRSVQTH